MCTAFKYLHIQSDIEIWVWKFYIYPIGPYLTDVYIRVYTVYMLQSEFGFQISFEAYFSIFHFSHGILDRSIPNTLQQWLLHSMASRLGIRQIDCDIEQRPSR